MSKDNLPSLIAAKSWGKVEFFEVYMLNKEKAKEAALLESCGYVDPEDISGSEIQFSRRIVNEMFDAGVDYANRWNIVERDGLPTKNRMYLVSLQGGEVAMAWLDADGQWGISYNEPYKLDEGDVVAYRERPMPYKGE